MGSSCSSEAGLGRTASGVASGGSHVYAAKESLGHGARTELKIPQASIDAFSDGTTDGPGAQRLLSVGKAQRRRERSTDSAGTSVARDVSPGASPPAAIVEASDGGGVLSANVDSEGEEPNLSELRKRVVLPEDWKESHRKRSVGDGEVSQALVSESSGPASEEKSVADSTLGAARDEPATHLEEKEGQVQHRGPSGTKGKALDAGRTTTTGRREEPESSGAPSGRMGGKAKLPAEARGVQHPRAPAADAVSVRSRAGKPPPGQSGDAATKRRTGEKRPAPSGLAAFKRAESGPVTSGSRATAPAARDHDARNTMSMRACKSPDPTRPGAGLDAPGPSDSPDLRRASGGAATSSNPVAVLKTRLGSKRRTSQEPRPPDEDDVDAILGQGGSSIRAPQVELSLAPGVGGSENVAPPFPRMRPSQIARQSRLLAAQAAAAPLDVSQPQPGTTDLPLLPRRGAFAPAPSSGQTGSPRNVQPLSPRGGDPQQPHQSPPALLPSVPNSVASLKQMRQSDPTDGRQNMQPAPGRKRMSGLGPMARAMSGGQDGESPPGIPEELLVGLQQLSFPAGLDDERFSRALARALPQLSQHLPPVDADAAPPPPGARPSLLRRPPKQSSTFNNGSPVKLDGAERQRMSSPQSHVLRRSTNREDEKDSPTASGSPSARLQPLLRGPLMTGVPSGWPGEAQTGAESGTGSVPSPPQVNPSNSNNQAEAIARLRNRRVNAPPTNGGGGGGAPRASEPEGGARFLPELPRPMTAADLKKERALAQRASEVEFVLRLGSLARDPDVDAAAAAVERLLDLLTAVDGASKRLDSESAVVYAYLLQHMAATQAADPKAMDRSIFASPGGGGPGNGLAVHAHSHPQNTEAPVWAEADDALGGARRVADLSARVADLRRMLRIKVQDKGDLQTARTALKEAKGFFEELAAHAQTRGVGQAEVLASLRALSSTPRPYGRGPNR